VKSENGKWKMENGKWKIENKKITLFEYNVRQGLN